MTGVIAPDWRDGSQYSDTDVTYSATAGRGGGVAQRMNVTAVRSGQAQVAHPIDFVSGWRYEVTMWVKGSGNLSVLFQQEPAPYAIYGDTAVQLTGEWQKIRLTGLIETTVAGYVVLQATNVADLAFDDVEVRAVQAKPTGVAGTKITPETFGIHEGRIVAMAMRNSGFEGSGFVAGTGKPLKTGAVITGAVATGWSENSFWANVDVAYAMDNAVAHQGATSQRIDVGAIRTGEVETGQYLTIRSPARIRFGMWVRGAAGTTGRLTIRQGGEPYATRASTPIAFTNQWQLITTETDLAATDAETFLYVAFDKPGTYWIDDASILNLTTNKAPDWIPAPSVGGTMRLWDTSTTWSQLEPQKGSWDFSVLDRFVSLAESRNQDVLLTLGQSPAWATSNDSELNYYGLGSVYAPKSIDDWRNMVRVITKRYKGRISGYEIWNEPNDPNFGRLSISELINLTKVASEEIRANDPAAKVVSASPYSPGYLDQYLAAGAADYVDIVGYHEYNNAPEEMLNKLSNVRAVLDDYGVNKPLWLTEGGSGDEKQTESVVADALLRWSLVSTASGMQRSFWYTWGPGFNISGTTIKDGSYEPNAAFFALADMQKRLAGRTLTRVTNSTATGQWVLEFTNAQGDVLKASWTRGGTSAAQPVVWS